jgi:hypothetical protein
VTGRPVAGAKLHAGRIEFDGSKMIGSGWAISDGDGRFRTGGLAPGVYNLCLFSSPRGRRFTATAIEGVRVRAGEDATADLKLIEGRRLHGTVVDIKTGRPMGAFPVVCSSTALPLSGNAGKQDYTDDQGRFEFFVPPGLACVYLGASGPFVSPFADKGPDTRTLIVAADRDPDAIRLEAGHDPDDRSLRIFTPALPTQVRIRAVSGEETPRADGRTLMGRVFDQDGSPIAGVAVTCRHRNRTMTLATDRLGVFRASGLPREEIFLGLRKKGYNGATAVIPAEAWEVEVTLPKRLAGE